MNKEIPIIERRENLAKGLHEIWLAGGCFWGLEKYAAGLRGVVATSVGYANGTVLSPSYKQVCSGTTGAAETVHIVYNPEELTLSRLIMMYMQAIDPTSLNRQGGDAGEQYRTGIYYLDEDDLPILRNAMELEQKSWRFPIVVELEPLKSYYLAEEYHQKYLEKNPGGYCHISNELCAAAWKESRNSN